jgi:hypothetical protein
LPVTDLAGALFQRAGSIVCSLEAIAQQIRTLHPEKSASEG